MSKATGKRHHTKIDRGVQARDSEIDTSACGMTNSVAHRFRNSAICNVRCLEKACWAYRDDAGLVVAATRDHPAEDGSGPSAFPTCPWLGRLPTESKMQPILRHLPGRAQRYSAPAPTV
jgi:formylglycine-generating enzyme required for sulfatase activity